MSILNRYTLKRLWKKKTRTIVTIIGIILSVSMFTAVTTTVSSIQNFMLEITVQDRGCWHVSTLVLEESQVQTLVNRPEVDSSALFGNVGYMKLDTAQRENTPYLHISGFSGNFPELMSVRMIEGRLPQNSSELIVPAGLAEKGVISCEVGNTIEKEMGLRRETKTGGIIWQDYPFDSDWETFDSQGSKTYKVVGVYESAQPLGWWGPSSVWIAGYEVLTRLDSHVSPYGEMAYMTLKEPGKAEEFQNSLEKKDNITTNMNSAYLQLAGYKRGGNLMQMLGALVLILMGIIMFGSIALIYNSFSISVNERKRECGLLSSIGATRRQLRRSVLFEAVVLSAVGVPLGVLAGIGGMALTFYLLRDAFSSIINVGGGLSIHMSAALWAVGAAAVMGFVTVLISAWFPARKALRLNPIEAIRQTTDIVVKPRKLKTSRLTAWLFGLAGTLATKNYKRNKRKYRAVIFSLFISVVLFVSASSFCDYMRVSLNDIINNYDSDIYCVNADVREIGGKTDEIYRALAQTEGVTESSFYYSLWDVVIKTPGKNLSELTYHNSVGEAKPENESELEKEVRVDNAVMVFVPDNVFRDYLEKNQLDPAQYMDVRHPLALLHAESVNYDTETERYRPDHMLEKTPKTMKMGIGQWTVEDDFEIKSWKTIEIGERIEDAPADISYDAGTQIALIYPICVMEAFVPKKEVKKLDFDCVMSFSAENPARAEEDMQEILDSRGLDYYLNNIAEQMRINRALMLILNIFSFGFILLISLIAMANVFNTISTNVFLRKREFAMLRSVGMTQKGFRKMSHFECLLYGFKGLIYGLPVAIGITALIWRAIEMGYTTGFYIPWYSIAIAVGSVFAVVFATMLYSTSKIRKDNVVDVLKEDNY